MKTTSPRLGANRLKVLRALDGRSVRKIGEQLGMTGAGVHAHLRCARADGLATTDGSRGGWRMTSRGEQILRALRAVGV